MDHHDPLDTRAQERAAADTADRARLAADVEAEDVKWLMKGPRGRRIVWRLLEQAGVFRLSFSTNAAQMAFNEGNRNAGNRLLALVHLHCPDLYPTMVKEANERQHPGDGAARNAQ